MLAILFQEKTQRNTRFPKKGRKNVNIIGKGLEGRDALVTDLIKDHLKSNIKRRLY